MEKDVFNSIQPFTKVYAMFMKWLMKTQLTKNSKQLL